MSQIPDSALVKAQAFLEKHGDRFILPPGLDKELAIWLKVQCYEFRWQNMKLTAEIEHLKEGVAFLACVVKSGEVWTDQCQSIFESLMGLEEERRDEPQDF